MAYQYLNLENRWPHFSLHDGASMGPGGIVQINGRLELARLPGEAQPTGPQLPPARSLAGPAGIGVDREGNLYLAEADNHQIIRVRACDGLSRPLPCLQGPGSDPGQLREPRGVVVGPRHALYVADSGNHRIQVVDLTTQQVRAVWGQPDPYADPAPGDEPGRLDTPWDLAVDGAGCLYVVDRNNSRIQKFDAGGRVKPAFWETMAQEAHPGLPRAAAVIFLAGQERLLVVDDGPLANGPLFIYNLDGSDAREDETVKRYLDRLTAAGALPADLAMSEGKLYVAQPERKRVLVFGPDGSFTGIVRVERGVAGLAVDQQGRLLVRPAEGGAVQRLERDVARAEQGTFVAGPFSAQPLAAQSGSQQPPRAEWQRLQVDVTLPEEGHLQLFTATSDTVAVPSSGKWKAAPVDAQDFLIRGEPGRYLWLRGAMQGDGQRSPQLSQIKVTYNTEGLSRYLPAVYRRQPGDLPEMLALLESALDRRSALINDLPRRFDPNATPDRRRPDSWLDWLAGWLDFELDETWSEAQRREAVAEAFALHSRRGTVESLRRLIALYGDATAHVEEPGLQASLWQLGGESHLGFDTTLAPAPPEGTVVGTTAVANASHLLEAEAYGGPLFEGVAHHFCVHLYAADLAGAGSLERVREVVEREKPAHMTYDICLIEARMRVGFQARIGVDTIVGAGRQPQPLAQGPALGRSTVLGESVERHPEGGRLGQDTAVGRRTRLT